MARIRVSIWDDPEFLILTREAQWLWFVCKTFSGTGDYSAARIARKTGRPIEVILKAEAALRGSPLDAILDDTRRRQKIPRATIEFVFDRDGRKCLHCQTAERLTIDHIWPVSRGGTDDVENLQTLCHSCNSKKGARV